MKKTRLIKYPDTAPLNDDLGIEDLNMGTGTSEPVRVYHASNFAMKQSIFFYALTLSS
jgi:hypothetical protein